MGRWPPFAGLADKFRGRPFQILFANPFKFSESVYPKVEAAVEKVGLVRNRKNLSVLRQASHPLVGRHGPEIAPGWNSSNREILANGEHACYVLFDRSGELVFQGRLTLEEVTKKVEELLR